MGHDQARIRTGTMPLPVRPRLGQSWPAWESNSAILASTPLVSGHIWLGLCSQPGQLRPQSPQIGRNRLWEQLWVFRELANIAAVHADKCRRADNSCRRGTERAAPPFRKGGAESAAPPFRKGSHYRGACRGAAALPSSVCRLRAAVGCPWGVLLRASAIGGRSRPVRSLECGVLEASAGDGISALGAADVGVFAKIRAGSTTCSTLEQFPARVSCFGEQTPRHTLFPFSCRPAPRPGRQRGDSDERTP